MVSDAEGMNLRTTVADLGIKTVEDFMHHDFTKNAGRAAEYLQRLQQRANLYEIMYVLT